MNGLTSKVLVEEPIEAILKPLSFYVNGLQKDALLIRTIMVYPVSCKWIRPIATNAGPRLQRSIHMRHDSMNADLVFRPTSCSTSPTDRVGWCQCTDMGGARRVRTGPPHRYDGGEQRH